AASRAGSGGATRSGLRRTALGSGANARVWRRGGVGACDRIQSGAAAGSRQTGADTSAAALVALFLGQVAEAAHALGQFLVLFGEILAVPARQCIVLEPQREVLHLGLAATVGAFGGGVVPALVVERIGDRRRAQDRKSVG